MKRTIIKSVNVSVIFFSFFLISLVSYAQQYEGTYAFKNVAKNKYISVDHLGEVNIENIRDRRNFIWTVKYVGKRNGLDTYKIQNASLGNAHLDLAGVGGCAGCAFLKSNSSNSAYQLFYINPSSTGVKISLTGEAPNFGYLSVDNNNPRVGRISGGSLAHNEWLLEKVVEPGLYRIKNRLSGNHIAYDGVRNNAQILQSQNPGNNTLWQVTIDGRGDYSFYHPNYLYVFNIPSLTSTQIQKPRLDSFLGRSRQTEKFKVNYQTTIGNKDYFRVRPSQKSVMFGPQKYIAVSTSEVAHGKPVYQVVSFQWQNQSTMDWEFVKAN